jgi:spore maturation protein CgeB
MANQLNILILYLSYSQTSIDLSVFCEEGFMSLGYQVERIGYNSLKFSARAPLFAAIEKEYSDYAVTSAIRRANPDLVLIIKGYPLSERLLKKIRATTMAPVVNYWIDDPFRIALSKKLSPAYDFFFTNSPDCVPVHKVSGCRNPRWLTFGASPCLHRKIKLPENKKAYYGSDLCFAGTLSQKRFEILEALADFDIKIWSDRCITHFDDVSGSTLKPVPASSPLYDKFTGRPVWGSELVKVYNAAKIALNIHDPQNCPIMRDFEIPGCGAFMLTDPARNLNGLFNIGEEIMTFDTIADLRKKAAYFIEHPDERAKIAAAGYRRVQLNHLYRNRMNELVAEVF